MYWDLFIYAVIFIKTFNCKVIIIWVFGFSDLSRNHEISFCNVGVKLNFITHEKSLLHIIQYLQEIIKRSKCR